MYLCYQGYVKDIRGAIRCVGAFHQQYTPLYTVNIECLSTLYVQSEEYMNYNLSSSHHHVHNGMLVAIYKGVLPW